MGVNSIQQLAATIGYHSNTIESISRAIYKGTDCGAWVDDRPVASVKTRKFKVIFSDSIYGIVAHQWHQIGQRGWHNFGEAITPIELKQYLGGQTPKMVGPYRFDWYNMLLIDTEHKMLAELRGSMESQDHPECQWMTRKKESAVITLAVNTPNLQRTNICRK